MEPITDLSAYLDEARQKVEENDALKKKAAELAGKQSEQFAALNRQKEDLQNTIRNTVSERRNQIIGTYDDELAGVQEKLKKVRTDREKARNEGVRERIVRETADCNSEIRNIKNQIRTELKNAGLPSFCDSNLFFAVFMPDSLPEILILIAVLAICFFLIPVGVWYLAFKAESPAVLILIYVIDIAVFLSLYLIISRRTVIDRQGVLRQVKEQRRSILRTEKRVEAITKNIREDKNESEYNLTSYDDDIARIEQQLADITMKKKDALNTFENVTRNIIADEITGNIKPVIDELEQKRLTVASELSRVESRRNELTMELSNRFESYLGKEFMRPDKLEALSDIVRNTTAATISEAIEEYRKDTEV